MRQTHNLSKVLDDKTARLVICNDNVCQMMVYIGKTAVLLNPGINDLTQYKDKIKSDSSDLQNKMTQGLRLASDAKSAKTISKKPEIATKKIVAQPTPPTAGPTYTPTTKKVEEPKKQAAPEQKPVIKDEEYPEPIVTRKSKSAEESKKA